MGDLMPWHKTRLAHMDYNRVDLVKEGANSQAHIKLFKNRKGGTLMTLEEILKSLKEEHRTVVEKALADKEEAASEAIEKAKTLEAQIEKGKDSGVATEEDILKSVTDPGLRAILETQIAKAKVAEEEIRKMREAEVDREAVSKAKEVPNLGTEETMLADVYKKLKNTDETLCDEVFGIFKAASALVAQGGALSEVGKSAGAAIGGASASEEDAWAKIEKAAEEIAKSSNINKTQAISKAIKDNPGLYKEYLQAQRG